MRKMLLKDHNKDLKSNFLDVVAFRDLAGVHSPIFSLNLLEGLFYDIRDQRKEWVQQRKYNLE